MKPGQEYRDGDGRLRIPCSKCLGRGYPLEGQQRMTERIGCGRCMGTGEVVETEEQE